MKYINNTICLEYNDLVNDQCLSAAAYKWAQARGTIKMISRGNNGSQALIEYDTMPVKYKNLVTTKFGDPHKHIAAQIIKQHLVTPQADIETISNYKLPDGTNLPIPRQGDYIKACGYLNLLATLTPRAIRAMGFKTVSEFNDGLLRVLDGDRVALPLSYAKRQAKVREYKKDGAACLISKRWCNANGKKVRDKEAENFLKEMIGNSLQFEDVYISHRYNKWAKANGRKTISYKTVGNFRRKHMIELMPTREGIAKWRSVYDPVVHRERPSMPLKFVCGDDNDLDWFFKTVETRYKRLTLYVVIDGFNNYPLGYAVGWNQTIDLVKAAFLNAVHHVKQLTGEYLCWSQVQADSWGIKSLRPYYEAQGLFIAPKTGNARSKPIEQSFGKGWHSILKQLTDKDNYSGANITAKSKANWEVISKRSKDFPTLIQGLVDIDHFIHTIRTQVDERKGYSKQEQWLEAFGKMPSEEKVMLTDEKRLLVFGYKRSDTNKLTNAGLTLTVNNKKHTYDIPEEAYAQHIMKSAHTYVDPYDMSQVLATTDDDARTRILCPANIKTKMAVADMKSGDGVLLNKWLQKKDKLYKNTLDKINSRKEMIQGSGVDMKQLLQPGLMTKEDKHKAEENYMRLLGGETSDRFDELDNPSDDLFIAEKKEEMDVYDLQIEQERRVAI